MSIRTPTKQWGVLFSHAQWNEEGTEREVEGPFASIKEAMARGSSVSVSARVEHEVLVRADDSAPWLSGKGETVSDVVRRRWGTP